MQSESSHQPHPFSAVVSYLLLPFSFDPKPRNSPTTINGNKIHHHVDTFIDNINYSITLHGSVFVRDNLHHCLRRNALDWYCDLPELDKLAIQTDLSYSLYQWITRLQRKFHSRKPLPAPLQDEKTMTQPPPLYSPQELAALVSTIIT